jgi:hypothetical protein
MMTCLPSDLLITAAKGRAKASVPPPGGNGTTKVTGLVGQSVACAKAPVADNAKAHAPTCISIRRLMIVFMDVSK